MKEILTTPQEAVNQLLWFLQLTNRHPFAMTRSDFFSFIAEYAREEPDDPFALWYKTATSADLAQLVCTFRDGFDELRQQEKTGGTFLCGGAYQGPYAWDQEGEQTMKPNNETNVLGDDFFDDDEFKGNPPGSQKNPGFFARLFGSKNNPGIMGNTPQGYQVPSLPADYTVQTQSPPPVQKSTTLMTQEELRTRRMNTIESAKFGRPAHESFMLVLLKFWLIVGPIAFVLLTTSEVAYILTSLVPPGDTSDYVIIGGALFIDIAMMFVTFGVAIKRRDLADKRESGTLSKREESEVLMGTIMWLTFATINIISQGAFLLHIISLGNTGNMTILYVFIAARVVGFILGDASTAFFLAKVDGSHIKLIARGEREKGSLYKEIAQAEGERRLIEAKAEADIMLVQLDIKNKTAEAEFLATLKDQVFETILSRNGQLGAPPSGPETPGRSRMRRMD